MTLERNPASVRRYLLQEAVLILVISYLVLFASTHNGLVYSPVLAVSAGLFSILLVCWLVFKPSARLPLELPGLTWMGVLALTTWTSLDQVRSLSELWLVGISFFLFFMTAQLVRWGWPGELIHKVLLVVIGLVMIFAWAEAANWYWQYVRATGQFLPQFSFRLSLPNFFGVLLNVLMMIAIARSLATTSLAGRVLLGIWIVSALGLIFLTSSRGGWLGTLAGFITLGFLTLPQYKTRCQALWGRMKARKPLLLALILFAGILLIGLAFLFYRQMQHPTHVPLFDSRAYLWKPAWDAFLRSPWLGEGPYRFISLYLRTKSVPPEPVFVYAHSIYLDVLSGSGVIGLLAFGWLLVTGFRHLIRATRRSDSLERAAAIGSLAGLAAFLVHGIFDSVHHTIPTSAWVLSILMGATLSSPEAARERRFSGAVGLGWVVVLLSWVNLWQVIPMQKGIEAANAERWGEAVGQFHLAAERNPGNAIAYQQLGLAYSALAQAGDKASLEMAIQAFEKAVLLDPDWPLNHANLGALYRTRGDLVLARRSFQQATERAWQAPLFWLNLAQTEELMEDFPRAGEHYAKVLGLRPDWVGAYYWRSTEFRQHCVADWLQKNQLSQAAEDIPALEEALQADPASGLNYVFLAEAFLQANQVDKAAEILRQADFAYFGNEEQKLSLAWEKARLAKEQGNLDEAVRLGELVRNGYFQQGLYGPGAYGHTVYAQLLFRRPAMSMDYVPQLTLLFPDDWGKCMLELAGWHSSIHDEAGAVELLDQLRRYLPDLTFEYR